MYQGGCLNEAIIYDTVHTEAQIKDYTKALNKKWKITLHCHRSLIPVERLACIIN